MIDRAVVISLRRRHDRLAEFCDLVDSCEWPFPAPDVFEAVDGGSGAVPVPRYWKSGGGAYGCQQSHIQVLQRALMDGVQSIFVMEDDASFRPDFGGCFREFFCRVPQNWEALMLGGQHIGSVAEAKDGVVLCRNTHRTHAYILRGPAIRDVCELFENSRHHIDWDMGPFLGRRGRTYAPSPFLVSQASSKSDINGNNNAAMRWSPPAERTAVAWIQGPRAVAEGLRKYGFHYGFFRDSDGNDKGLNTIFQSPGVASGDLSRWLTTVEWECSAVPEADAIPSIWHPHATEPCRAAIESVCECVTIKADSLGDALSQAKAAFGEKLVFLRKKPL